MSGTTSHFRLVHSLNDSINDAVLYVRMSQALRYQSDPVFLLAG